MLTQLIKSACVNLTTSSVTSRLIGIRLLYRMMKVSRLYQKFREMSPIEQHTHNTCLQKQFCLVCACVLGTEGVYTCTREVPTLHVLLTVLLIPDGRTNRAHQCHDKEDPEQHQDLNVRHSLHVGALQRSFSRVL